MNMYALAYTERTPRADIESRVLANVGQTQANQISGGSTSDI